MEQKVTAPGPNTYDRPIFSREKVSSGRDRTGTPRVERRMSLNMKLFLFAAVVFLGFGAALAALLRPAESRYVLDTYQVATVGVRDFRNVARTSGRVVPSEVIVLSSPRDAVVLDVFHKAGDDVEEGALLARLRSDELEAELHRARLELDLALVEAEQAALRDRLERAEAESQVGEARGRLAGAQANLDLMNELLALGGVSRRERDDAEAAVQAAAAALLRAEERLRVIERQAELAAQRAERQVELHRLKVAELEEVQVRLNLVAPRKARVLEAAVAPGDPVGRGAVAFRLADVTRQYVETVVTPEQAVRLSTGAPAVIRTAGAQAPARVVEVAPLAVAGSAGAQVPVRLALEPDIAARIIPNTSVSVEIELGAFENRPYLLRGPYFASGDASFVYVIAPDGTKAERREVRYGAIDGEYVEVVSGVEPGERIIYSSYAAYRSYPVIELKPEGGRPVDE